MSQLHLVASFFSLKSIDLIFTRATSSSVIGLADMSSQSVQCLHTIYSVDNAEPTLRKNDSNELLPFVEYIEVVGHLKRSRIYAIIHFPVISATLLQ